MILRLPSYYKEFTCIADRCKDSCCVGWEIDIDEETFAYYKSIPGEFGERLRANMTVGEENSFRLKSGSRCPFLNEKNLCDIVLTLGETSLCEICTEYPRFTLEYADVREKCLGISCEEVGRIIFEKKEPITFEDSVIEEAYLVEADGCEEDGWEPEDDCEEDSWEPEETGEYPEEAELAAELQKAVNCCIRILQNRELPIEERICRYLIFCEEVQEWLNAEDAGGMDVLISRAEACGKSEEAGSCMGKENGEAAGSCKGKEIGEAAGSCMGDETAESFAERKQILNGMEILDEEWRGAIAHVEEVYSHWSAEEREKLLRDFMQFYRNREYEYEHLMVYFVFRYAMKSVFDYQFLAKAQLAVLSFLTIRDMDTVRFLDQGGRFQLADRIDNARIYSKEVEHSEDNLEYLAEEFMFADSMRPGALRKQVRFGREYTG